MDHLHAVNMLAHQRRLPASRLALVMKIPKRFFRDKSRNQKGERCHADHHKRDYPVDHEHEKERSNNRQDAREKLRKAHQQPVRKKLNIRDHSAHKISRRMRIKIRKR